MEAIVTSEKLNLTESTGQSSSSSLPLVISAASTELPVPHPQAPVSSDHDLFNKVFTNDIVWNKLGSYLNLDDLKDCRLTCSLFNTKIINDGSFRDRALVNIPLSKFPASNFDKTRVQWRHLAIDIDQDHDDTKAENCCDFSEDSLSNLSKRLASIISLKIQRTDYYCNLETPHEVPEAFFTILPMMPNIQKLSIDVRGFQNSCLSRFAHASVTLMSKVKEFHLECNLENFVPDVVKPSFMSLPLDSVQIHFSRIHSLRRDIFQDHGIVMNGLDQLFQILRQNQNHLKSFKIQDPELWTSTSAERFGTLPKFPQLKVLQLRIKEHTFSDAHLIEFLNNQPESLAEMDLDFIGSTPLALLQIVKDRALNLNLKVLRVRMIHCNPSDIDNWNFLKDTNLEEFSFEQSGFPVRLSDEQFRDFFVRLPKKAKKLSIKGVNATSMQPVSNLEVSKCFDPKILTHLNLQGLTGWMKDSVLQEIWKTLKNLRLLDLSYLGSHCTDWGFTGIPVGCAPQGVSISLLKGLKSLSLQNGTGLTNRTLVDGIKFLELQFLDLKYNSEFTKIGFLAVIRQNPSLQTLVTDHFQDIHEHLPGHSYQTDQMISAKINSRLTQEFRRDGMCDRCPQEVVDEDDDVDDNDDVDNLDSDESESEDGCCDLRGLERRLFGRRCHNGWPKFF